MNKIYKFLLMFSLNSWILIKNITNIYILGRILEGISVGIYANNINIFIDSGVGLDLIYKFLIAIIFTSVGIILQRR